MTTNKSKATNRSNQRVETVHDRKVFRTLPTPTIHPPGSEAKILELARRVELGQELWHPADRREKEDEEGWTPHWGESNHEGFYIEGDLSDLSDLAGDAAHVVDVGPCVGSVDPSDDFGAVPELVCDLLESLPAFDSGTCVTVPEAIAGDVSDGIVLVESDSLGASSQMPSECVTVPGRSIAVCENISALGISLEPCKEPGGDRGQGNDSGSPGLLDGFVLFQANVGLDVKVHVGPLDLTHFASPGPGMPEEEQGASERLRSFANEGEVFAIQGWPSWNRRFSFQGFRESVRATVDKLAFLLVGSPIEATDDGGNGSLFGVLRLPILLVRAKPFSQVVLSTIFNESIASEKVRKVPQVSFAVRNVIRAHVSGEASPFKVRRVGPNKGFDRHRFIAGLFVEKCKGGHWSGP